MRRLSAALRGEAAAESSTAADAAGASAEVEERTEPNEPRIWGEPDPSWEEPAPPDDGTDSADYGRTEEVGVSRPEQKRPRKPGPIDLKDVLVWWASSPYPSLERADHIIFR